MNRERFQVSNNLLFEDETENENLRKQTFHLQSDLRKRDEKITSLEKKKKLNERTTSANSGANVKIAIASNKTYKPDPTSHGSEEVTILHQKIKLLESTNSFLTYPSDGRVPLPFTPSPVSAENRSMSFLTLLVMAENRSMSFLTLLTPVSAWRGSLPSPGCGEKGGCGSLPGEGRVLRFSAEGRKSGSLPEEEGSLPSPRSGEKESCGSLPEIVLYDMSIVQYDVRIVQYEMRIVQYEMCIVQYETLSACTIVYIRTFLTAWIVQDEHLFV
ncbi:hypothetical protein M5K25_001798 [Dendrobium thyrsiflorum]|uniref:Uncharacterized protein n=1 Tax=Dendrobium thyrsiflorum TaxID=117978 RepID=A0ABD0VSR3_DENTH